MFKKLVSLVIILALSLGLTACGTDNKDNSDADAEKTLTIAYQNGIGYAPVHIMESKKLIESNYSGKVNVKFVKLDSGAAINEGIIGGTIDIGCMGVAPAISGVVAGIPYKCIANLTSQPSGLMTNKAEIKSLQDITSEDKIALVNIGSIQHIILAMAAEKYLGDSHALDNNIAAMSHVEGMAALESGTVALHLTSSPYIGQERADSRYTELPEVVDVCPPGNTLLVAMGSTKIAEDKELFNAVLKAFEQSSDILTNNKDEAADIEAKYLSIDKETALNNLNDPLCTYDKELKGVKNVVEFMFRAGFITNELDFENFKFTEVSGN